MTMHEKFKPLFDIRAAAQPTLFEPDKSALLAELLATDEAAFHRLMAQYRGDHVPKVRDIEAHAVRTLKAARKRQQETKKKKAAPAAAVGFKRDENEKILTTQGNILMAVERLGVRLRFNEFAGSRIIEGLPDYGPFLDDAALDRLYFTIDQTFDFRPTEPFFSRFIFDCCHGNRFHPVRDYLDGLTWDRVPRLDTWLVRYARVADSELARACGAKLLIAAVRRVRKPGTKFDEMAVLEGIEGLQKSTLLKLLAVHEDWFSDSLPLAVDDKIVIEATAGKWIIEVGELQGISKGDHTKIKAQLSRTTDRARLAYGRLPVERKRQFVIIGTTNGKRYLASMTGNRRFLPFRVEGKIDLEFIQGRSRPTLGRSERTRSRGRVPSNCRNHCGPKRAVNKRSASLITRFLTSSLLQSASKKGLCL